MFDGHIYHGYPIICKSISIVLWEWLCCYLQVKYIVYKHFDRSLNIWLSDPTCVQNFKPVPLTVFEIQGLKLNNNKQEKAEELEKWTFCHISLMLVV